MFARIIETEIKWCEENNGAMPPEFRRGFIAGLNQALYLINATIQRSVWQDGEIVDDDDLLDRAAELPLEPSAQQNGADEVCAKCGCAEPFHYSGCEDAAKAPF